MRPIALGRSNWIHIGSEDAGPRIAAIFSVVKAAAGSTSRSVITWPLSFQDLQMRHYSAPQNLPLLPGLPDIPICEPWVCPDGYQRLPPATLRCEGPHGARFTGRTEMRRQDTHSP